MYLYNGKIFPDFSSAANAVCADNPSVLDDYMPDLINMLVQDVEIKPLNRKAKIIQGKASSLPVKEFERGGQIVPNMYLVTGHHGTYEVDTLKGTCSCDWGTKRLHEKASTCSHYVAALRFEAQANKTRPPSLWSNLEDAKKQHRHIEDLGDGLISTTGGTK